MRAGGFQLMPQGHEARYRELLARQLAMNQQTWRTLQSHGVTTETLLRLDFGYIAPDERSANNLKGLLEDQTDYEIRVECEGSQWSVVGSTQPTAVSPEVLDQWVDWMVTAGLERDCEFDGWGTEV